MKRKLSHALFGFLLASCAVVSSNAVSVTPKTLLVDPHGDPNNSYASIQAAIDQSAEGDTILVAAGTYKENISFGTKNITLESESGPAKTIVIAAEKDAVVTMRGGTLRGFTLTEGSGRPASSSYGSDYYGGGVHAGYDSLIENCAIVGNGKGTPRKNSGTFAGGVYAGSKSNVVVRGCLIYDNYAWACGGAVLVDHSGSLTLENCTVYKNNSTNFFGHQGGLGMANGGQLFIRNCIVWGNSGDEIGAFSGIYAKGTKATVSHSIIEGGYAGDGNLKVGGSLFKNANNVVGLDGEYGSKDDGLRLLGNSPAINVGSGNKALGTIDLAGFLRLQGDSIDLGCYEFGNEFPESDVEKFNLESGLVAHYPFSGDGNDVSGNEYHGRVVGPSLSEDRYGKLNRAYSFDGIDDYIEAEGFNWSNRENATISMWSYYPEVPKAEESVYRMIFGMNNEAHCLFLHRSKLYYRQGWGNGWLDAPRAKEWYHFTLSWSQVDKKVSFFLNGQKIQQHGAYQNVGLGKGSFRIGANDRVKNYHFQGGIDDIRIYDRTLSEEEVVALYDLEKPFDEEEGLMAYYPFNGDAKDHSGNENHGKIVGATLSTDRLGELDQAYDFNSKNYITVEDDSNLNVSSAVSVSAWMAPPSAGFPKVQNWWEKMWIVGKNRDITSGYHLFIGEGGLLQGWVVAENNGSSTSFLLPENKDWSHCVLTYSEKKGGALYYNGKLVDSSEAAGPIICYDEKEGFSIGRLTTFNLFHFKGLIDEVRVYDRALTDKDVTALYELEKSPADSIAKPRPPIGPPTGPPEPLVDYIKLLKEITAEIASVEKGLNILLEEGKDKDSEIEKLKAEWAKLNGEIRETRTNLANCQEDCNRTREETARVKKEIVVHDLEILRLEGKLRGSADRLSTLRNERDGVRKQITEMEKQLEEAQVKLSTAHTPGWHYVSNYGWLWTSPEHYPLIYSNDREGWVYYERGTSEPWLYYDYNTEKWEQWFHESPLFSASN